MTIVPTDSRQAEGFLSVPAGAMMVAERTDRVTVYGSAPVQNERLREVEAVAQGLRLRNAELAVRVADLETVLVRSRQESQYLVESAFRFFNTVEKPPLMQRAEAAEARATIAETRATTAEQRIATTERAARLAVAQTRRRGIRNAAVTAVITAVATAAITTAVIFRAQRRA